MMLRIMGHEVRTAHDGEAGVAAAAEFRPDVILLDLGMPELNGYEAARRIRAEPWGDGPFLIALTGWGADEDRRRTHEAGFDHHLVKPVDPDALTENDRRDADRIALTFAQDRVPWCGRLPRERPGPNTRFPTLGLGEAETEEDESGAGTPNMPPGGHPRIDAARTSAPAPPRSQPARSDAAAATSRPTLACPAHRRSPRASSCGPGGVTAVQFPRRRVAVRPPASGATRGSTSLYVAAGPPRGVACGSEFVRSAGRVPLGLQEFRRATCPPAARAPRRPVLPVRATPPAQTRATAWKVHVFLPVEGGDRVSDCLPASSSAPGGPGRRRSCPPSCCSLPAPPPSAGADAGATPQGSPRRQAPRFPPDGVPPTCIPRRPPRPAL